MTEKQNTPEIRFEGFTDPWEQRKLGKLVDDIATGKSVNSDDGIVGPGDVGIMKTSCVSYDTFDARESKRVLPEEQSLVACPVEAKTLIVSRMNTPDRVGACGFVADNWPNLFLPDRLWRVRLRNSVDPYLVYVLLTSDGSKKVLRGMASGTSGSMHNIPKESFLDMELALPTSLEEQSKIAKQFASLDKLITLHQRKYDKLCTVKKSMLDKMFPKPGETEPEIRFEGFTDPWEQRKLSEVATFGGGHTPPMADPDNYEDGYVLWVTSQDVKSNYLDRTTTQITEKGAKELTLYPAGSLVMVTRSGILRHTLPVAELRKPSTVNQDIRVILPHSECCGEWLLQFFISHNKELLLEFGKTGTTVESVDFGKIKDMLLHMPSTVEQQQIGDYFAKLDRLITLHQRKLELLRNIKKSLLDRMFV